jgi:TonB family protein
MTLWLTNLAAFSVQFGALIVASAAIVSVLRLSAPRAMLRFWQTVFAAAVLWPAWQLVAPVVTSGSTSMLGARFATTALWPSSVEGAGLHSTMASVDTNVAAMILGVVAIGSIVRIAWVAVGLMQLRLIQASSDPADAVYDVALSLERELGVTANVRFSDAVAAPATLGVRRPTILLPRRVSQLSLPLQRAMLCHELIHVRRRDWLATVAEELWCAALWFHPAARALTSRLSLSRETLVDNLTIAYTRDRHAYAAALLEFSTSRPQPMATTGLIGRRHLEQRLILIAEEVPMPRWSLALRIVVAAATVMATIVGTTSGAPLVTTLQAQEKIYKPAEDSTVTLPQVVKEVKPAYTARALQARIQGTVWLTVVILSNGTTGDVSVAKSLDKEHGLDDAAVQAARQWVFRPGTKDGEPVNVEVTIEMTFTLKK